MSKTEIAGKTAAVAMLLFSIVVAADLLIERSHRKDAGQIRIQGWVNADDATAVLEALKRGAEMPKSALAAGEGADGK